MLQKIKERLEAWGYSFTEPEAAETEPEEETEETSQTEETVEQTEETAEDESEEEPEEETPTPDEMTILFLIAKTDAYIKNFCNITEIPEELLWSEVDMIAIEFLKEKAMAGALDTSGLRIDNLSSITEGDVSISYASGSYIALPYIFEQIKGRFEADLMPFRRLRW